MNKARIIQLPKNGDRRGNLSVIEQLDRIPFKIERAFWIYDVPGGAARGGHAYREEERGPGSRHTGVQFLLSEESIDDCKVPMGCPTKHFIA